MKNCRILRLIVSCLGVWVCLSTCPALAAEMNLPAALTCVEERAFEGDTAIEHVLLPEGAQTIGSRAFADCGNLATIQIPVSVTEIADDAFDGSDLLVILCPAGSAAEMYALEKGIDVQITDEVNLSLTASIAYGEAGAEIVWTAEAKHAREGALYAFSVTRDGEEVLAKAASQDTSIVLDDAQPGVYRAVCTYTDGRSSQTAISSKTQIVGEMSAVLVSMDQQAGTGDQLIWWLTLNQNAGTSSIRYTLYLDGEEISESGATTATEFSVLAQHAGRYSLTAACMDALGREITVEGPPIQVNASTETSPLTYLRDSTGYVVIGCDYEATDVVIPDMRNDLPVHSIAESAFAMHTNLESVTTGANISTIGSYAFHGCTALREVALYGEVTLLEEGVFSGCSSLTSVTGLDVIDTVKEGAFSGCTKLSSVRFGDKLTSLGKNTFRNCSALMSVSVGTALESIGESCFSGCVSLKSLPVCEATTSIAAHAFVGCESLTSITLPEGLASVSDGAFASCSGLKKVTFANPDIELKGNVFQYCKGVTLEAEGTVETLMGLAEKTGFDYVDLSVPVIREVTIRGERKTRLEMKWHVSVQNGTAPYSFTYMLYQDGQLCSESEATASSTYTFTPQEEGAYTLEVVLTDACGNTTQTTCEVVEVAENDFPSEEECLACLTYELNDYGTYTITDCVNKLEKLAIPAEINGIAVTEIGDNALYYIGRTLEIILPDTITRIGANAFSTCLSLERINIPNGVTEIGESAFRNCSKLKEIEIPDSVTAIGSYAFFNCADLSAIEIPDSVSIIPEGCFNSCDSLSHVTLGKKTTEIQKQAFYECKAIETLDLPDTLNKIGSEAFSNCSALTKADIPPCVTEIHDSAFAYTGLEDHLQLPESLIYLGAHAFRNTKLQSVSILNSPDDFGNGVFRECSELKLVDLPETLDEIGPYWFMNCTSLEDFDFSHIYTVGSYAFYGTALRNISLPSTSIAPLAFAYCENLKFAEIKSCEALGYQGSGRHFQHCHNLETVILSDNLNYIAEEVFAHCYSLKNIVLPDQYLKTIWTNAFYRCESLETLVLPASLSTIKPNAFDGCYNLKLTATGGAGVSFIENYGSGLTAEEMALTPALSAEVAFSEPKDDGSSIDATISVYNNKRATFSTASSNWIEALAAAKAKNVTLTVTSSCMSVQLGDNGTVVYPGSTATEVVSLGDIDYSFGEANITAHLTCQSSTPSTCNHSSLRVTVNADNCKTYSGSFSISADFPICYEQDVYIFTPTTWTENTVVNANVYVNSALTVDGANLKCSGAIQINNGGEFIVQNSGYTTMHDLIIEKGGTATLDTSGMIRADTVSDNGMFRFAANGTRANVETFRVGASGILDMRAGGDLQAPVFYFHADTKHEPWLTAGGITAKSATITQGFGAGGTHTFVVRGIGCKLDVKDTFPRQFFNCLAIDCEINSVDIPNVNLKANRFVLPEAAIHKQMLLADQVGQLAYELYTKAVLGDLADEEKLRETLDGWYDAEIPKSSGLTRAQESKLNNYMQDAILNWLVALAADSQDKWENTSDIINSLYATGQGETFEFEDGAVVISVNPLGGLSFSGSIATAGHLTCTMNGKSFICPFYMNSKGVSEGVTKLLDVITEFAQNETLKELKYAMEKTFGKDSAKYINAIIDVIGESIISEKDITEVIYENYVKDAVSDKFEKEAKELVEGKFKIATDIAKFKKEWDKFIAIVKEGSDYTEYFKNACAGSTEDVAKMMEQYTKLLKLQ